MANRTVTLTGTTVGTSITTVDIYHTTVDAVNLVVSGVTREDLIAGYSFVDDDTHNIYIIVADSPCSTQDTVTFSVSPTPTATVTQTATPATTPTNTPTPTGTPAVTSTPILTVTPTPSPLISTEFLWYQYRIGGGGTNYISWSTVNDPLVANNIICDYWDVFAGSGSSGTTVKYQAPFQVGTYLGTFADYNQPFGAGNYIKGDYASIASDFSSSVNELISVDGNGYITAIQSISSTCS